MPFGQNNAGATYQHLINKIFKEQIGQNIEIYVDNILVKSKIAKTHVEHLRESFNTSSNY